VTGCAKGLIAALTSDFGFLILDSGFTGLTSDARGTTCRCGAIAQIANQESQVSNTGVSPLKSQTTNRQPQTCRSQAWLK
jgi:hypothetical protein